MATRKYILQINDIRTNKPVVYLDSDKSPFQIKTAINYADISYSAQLVYLQLYNFNDNLDLTSWINNKITLIAGSNYGSMLQLNNIDNAVISPKLILTGYIYDASYDYSEMPRQKINIKIRNFISDFNFKKGTRLEQKNIDNPYSKSYITSQITTGPVYGKGDSPSKPLKSNLILSKGSDVINFCKRAYRQYTGEELYNMTGEEKIINNFDTISYYFDPRRNDIVLVLNDFLNTFSSQGYAYPLTITSNLTGFALGINFATCNREQLQSLMNKFKDVNRFKPLNVKDDKESNYNEWYDRNLLQETKSSNFPKSFNLTNNILLSPPVRTSSNRVVIQTLLIPSIRKGDLIVLGNNTKDKNPDGTIKKLRPAASVSFGVIPSTAATWNNLSGTFFVDSVTHNLNYVEQSPVSWSTALELIQYPESINVSLNQMYSELS